jgi:HSP20 family protein
MSVESTIANGAEQQQTEPVERTRTAPCYRPNVDIRELPEELLILADLPGVRSEDIDIHFEDRQLTISGRVAPRQPDGTRYLLREYGLGDFSRTFRVSEQIDGARISAECRDGVLTLHLPKVEAAKPRKIAVKAK